MSLTAVAQRAYLVTREPAGMFSRESAWGESLDSLSKRSVYG